MVERRANLPHSLFQLQLISSFHRSKIHLNDIIDILCGAVAAYRLHRGFVYLFVPLSHDTRLTERIRIETDTYTAAMITRRLYRDAFTRIMQMCSRSAVEDEDTGSWGGSYFSWDKKPRAAAVNKLRRDS